MNSPYLVLATNSEGRLRIVSAHVNYGLALESAVKVMAEKPSFHSSSDPWAPNPHQILREGFPGRLIRAWKNTSRYKRDDAMTSLKIVELDVEGTILDQLAAID